MIIFKNKQSSCFKVQDTRKQPFIRNYWTGSSGWSTTTPFPAASLRPRGARRFNWHVCIIFFLSSYIKPVVNLQCRDFPQRLTHLSVFRIKIFSFYIVQDATREGCDPMAPDFMDTIRFFLSEMAPWLWRLEYKRLDAVFQNLNCTVLHFTTYQVDTNITLMYMTTYSVLGMIDTIKPFKHNII